MRVISCLKCDYSRREKIEKQDIQNETDESFNEIDILNKLDEQNERNS